MQKNIYLDHNATTPMKPAVRHFMLEMLEFCGNPSSVHRPGRESRRKIDAARNQIARLVGAGERDVIVFTSGATEANNLVLKGSGCERVLVSAVEHVSVLGAVSFLPIPAQAGIQSVDPGLRRGGEIIPVHPNGVIDLDALDKMLADTPCSTLVSVMLVNNETGVIQPVGEVAALARKHGALVHTDAAQAAGRIPVDMKTLGVDYLTLSAHKMGGPQGAGCLVMANCASVEPMIRGGNQEKNFRAGTENVPAIAGFGLAAELAAADREGFHKLESLRDGMEEALLKIAPGLKIFGRDAPRVANTSMFAPPDLASETQLIALDLEGIAVSNGSACSSGTVKPSPVLQAMGATEDEIASSLRVSLGWNTTEEEVACFILKWKEMYERNKRRHALHPA